MKQRLLSLAGGLMLTLFPISAFCQSYTLLYPPNYTTGYWYVYCYDQYGYLENCYETISTTAYLNSNGHFHNTSRPVSTPNPSSGWTNYGALYFTVTTTRTGQAENLQACNIYNCSSQDYGVGYTLTWNDQPQYWIKVGATTIHGATNYNHWMTSNAAWGLYYAVGDYMALHPDQVLVASNDMSLPYGGVFDIKANNGGDWTSPHNAHDWGTAADFRDNGGQYTLLYDIDFANACISRGSIETLHEFPGTSSEHIHCRWQY